MAEHKDHSHDSPMPWQQSTVYVIGGAFISLTLAALFGWQGWEQVMSHLGFIAGGMGIVMGISDLFKNPPPRPGLVAVGITVAIVLIGIWNRWLSATVDLV